MAGQFIHIDTYGMSQRAGKPKWANISGILLEAGRVAGAVGHIATPVPPTLLFGVPAETLIEEAERLALTAVDAMGRRLRRDGAVLVAGVASYPATVEELKRNPVDHDAYHLWRSDTTRWLKKRFGSALRSVLDHEDEARPHLHFMVLPRLAPDGVLDWSLAHPGLATKRRGALAGNDKKAQDQAYRSEMRRFQDDYFKDVSDFFGFDRYRGQRARVSRMERQAQIRLEAERALMLHEIRTTEHEALLNAEFEARERVQDELKAMQNAYDQARRDVEHERARAARAEDEIERLRAMLAEIGGADLSRTVDC